MTRFYLTILSFLFYCFSTAQISESFADGDYTANPTWTVSSATDFSVNAGQLKSANTTSNSAFYISTTNTLSSNCTWEFWVNLQFATSGANYVDAYLISDNTNLSSTSINGYFVRIGNTSDDISLYKSSAGTQTVLIDGVNASVSSTSNNLIKIRVTRTSANLFTLERDMTGTGSSYVTEGTITDASFTSSTAFGFLIKQSTATFFGKHLFDDINVATIFADVTPPSIVNSTVLSNTQLDVLFNEPVEITSAQTITNYAVNNSIGNPNTVTRDVSNFALVHLSFTTPFTNAVTNTLTVSGVQDIALNAITTATTAFTYTTAVTPVFKDLVINEIFADPSPVINLTTAEFIEIYNRSSTAFNLNGLKFTDNTSTATLGNYTLAPNSYVIICPVADTAQFTALGYMNKLGVSSFPSLNNTGDNIYLKTSAGVYIDSVNYSDTWYQDATKKLGGWTLEQINPNLNAGCSQSANWIASNDSDGGTPGFINSVYSNTPDLTGPTISSVNIIDNTHISVCFGEAISSTQLSTISNYTITGGIGSPTLATATFTNMCVTLDLSSTMVNATTYTVTIAGITDCSGNALSPNTIAFTFTADVTPPGILSNTVISNTQVDVLFNETVEITSAQTTTNYLANNGLGNPVTAARDASNFALVHLTFGTPFTNGTINTLSVSGVMDVALNAISTATTNFTYFATAIPVFKDMVINEIFADPSPVINLTTAEFIEIYNRSSFAFNLNGLKVADSYTATGATLGNYLLAPGNYVIICPVADTAQFTALGYMNKLGISSFPSLNNAGDNVYLKTSGGVFIDSVNYSDAWYQDATKKLGGWTLEQINPDLNAGCSQSSNWIASNDSDGGTPGFVNSVYSIAPDVTGPIINSVSVIDNTHITVCLNDLISSAQLTATSNYTISGGIGSPTLSVANPGNMCATLSLNTALTNQATYTVTVSGITDCSGNIVTPATFTFTYIVFDTPAFSDVIVNEIMVDVNPVPNGLPAVQYLELYNKSNKYFNLNGWKFSDGSTTSTITANYALTPNAYVVITKSTDTAGFVGVYNKIGTSSFPTYNISGDAVFLFDNASNVIDSIRYTTAWYQNTTKDDGGWSLELKNPTLNTNCLDATNWIASNDNNGGTPGIVNSVFSLALDVIAPKINSVYVIDSLHLSVCFDDVITTSQLITAFNYTINGGIGSPTLSIASSGNMCVTLSLSNKLVNATSYTITISGITDCNGNSLSPNTKAFSHYKAKPYDVVINELMPDPDPSIALPVEEYVELKNRTNFSINLKNWSFSSLTTSKKLPDMTIAPNGYVVLVGSGVAPQFLNNFAITVYEVPSFPSLLNDGTTLTLRDTNDVVISSVSYSSSWYNDANKSDGGWSLEQIDANNPCAGQSNWHASTHPNGGTPAYPNSVAASNPDIASPAVERVVVITADTIAIIFTEPLDSITLSNPLNYTFDNGLTTPTFVKAIAPDFKKVILKISSSLQVGIIYNVTVLSGVTDCVGNPLINGSAAFALPEPAAPNDVVINEILFDPNTGGVDFVELYNRSKKTINLKDLRIGSMDTLTGTLTDTKTITDEGYLLFPENYLVISENGAAIKQQYGTPNPKGFLDIADLPSMNTDDDVVTLSDASFTVIDNFIYTSKMHFPLLISTKGVSLERIDFNRPTDDKTNWNSASEGVGFATPAYRNSQYLQADGGSGVSIPNPLFSPDNDGYNDVLNISFKLDEPGKAANVFIFDSRGRQVRHLVRNEQLSTEGVISWNGINDDNEKAPIGIYVVYIELFNLSGKINKYKLSCTLAGKL